MVSGQLMGDAGVAGYSGPATLGCGVVLWIDCLGGWGRGGQAIVRREL